MGWVTVENMKGRAVRHPDRVRLATTGKPGKVKLRITIGAAVVAGLGWKPGDVLAIQCGAGPDHGRMRVVKVAAGGFVAKGKGDKAPLTITAAAWWPGAAAERLDLVEPKIQDKAVVLAMPDWIKPPQATAAAKAA